MKCFLLINFKMPTTVMMHHDLYVSMEKNEGHLRIIGDNLPRALKPYFFNHKTGFFILSKTNTEISIHLIRQI